MKSNICFSLDVLSDGSEFTGATLFLSVWKRPGSLQCTDEDYEWLKESTDLSPPLARYAIAGLGDATARLCADQRLKLSSTRAVFVPSGECAGGISAVLLALINSGSPSLHVVSDDSLNVEDLASIILGKHRHLNIMTCHVPSQRNWWKVYSDNYLTAYAQKPPMQGSIIYLYAIGLQQDPKERLFTIAVLPPECDDLMSALDYLHSDDLPLLDDDSDLRLSLDYVIVLNPKNYHQDKQAYTRGDYEIFVTLPSDSVLQTTNPSPDPGLLIHAQQVANHFACQMPWAFSSSSSELDTSPTLNPPFAKATSSPFLLRSCTSVLLGTPSRILFDRRLDAWNRPLSDEWSAIVLSLQSLIPDPNAVAVDENEISLDDDSDDLDEEVRLCKPQLVVLGTGCASPSAIRGASGYALIVPSEIHDDSTMEVFLLDCGEGVSTMLERTCQHIDWIHSIHGIWISHSHLDHYGGLPNLLQTISNARRQKPSSIKSSQIDSSSPPSPKRPRVQLERQQPRIPWVMAPAKVLHYLDVMLNCRHGKKKTATTTGEQLFIPLLHQDPTMPPGPWSFFQNIKVYHNCCPSYGLLLRLKDSWLCYSGDTRPCRSLVSACHRHRHCDEDLLLIHEATFEQSEQEQAQIKKHSTVTEALSIASQIPATRVLLSHFSQRYLSMEQPPPSNDGKTPIPMGYAMDGLRLDL
eukprot:scaffold1390_cov138-Cylindrotheca_fusiformis.AAC.61